MATNFSPCKGSYVLNQFPSNVMFGMNGFHVSASGAIQGHHGPLVSLSAGIIFGMYQDILSNLILHASTQAALKIALLSLSRVKVRFCLRPYIILL